MTDFKKVVFDALDLKEQSIKRAMNSKATNPRFQEVYQAELIDIADTRVELATLFAPPNKKG